MDKNFKLDLHQMKFKEDRNSPEDTSRIDPLTSFDFTVANNKLKQEELLTEVTVRTKSIEQSL